MTKIVKRRLWCVNCGKRPREASDIMCKECNASYVSAFGNDSLKETKDQFSKIMAMFPTMKKAD